MKNLLKLLSPTENRIMSVETENVNYLILGYLESAARGAIWGGVLGGLTGGVASLVEGEGYNPGYIAVGSVLGLALDEAVNITRTLCLAWAKRSGPTYYKEFLRKFYGRSKK